MNVSTCPGAHVPMFRFGALRRARFAAALPSSATELGATRTIEFHSRVGTVVNPALLMLVDALPTRYWNVLVNVVWVPRRHCSTSNATFAAVYVVCVLFTNETPNRGWLLVCAPLPSARSALPSAPKLPSTPR